MIGKFLKILIIFIIITGCDNDSQSVSTDFDFTEIGIAKIESEELKDGDIIFQTSKSNQSKAIQLATKSKYSHCGLIFKKESGKDKWCVIEAVQPVKWTPLSEWINRGEGGHYVVKRFISDPMLPDEMLVELRIIAEGYLGKNYDVYFNWSDDKVYCSELVWKSYYKLNQFEIGELQTLKDFDLTNDLVKQKMKERYGSNIPMDEKVISPAAIFNSNRLLTVVEK
ncbi:MAG: YiiX family permuted papain-like enzyme [Flavobacteriales bacterium]|nr:YiiX family permuted papain-like enzyme [Flavobacteriales bacterium]